MCTNIAVITTETNLTRHGRALAARELSVPGSEHTLQAYRRNFGQFCGWLDGHGRDLLGVERVHIDGYRHTQTGAPATVAQKLAAVSSFYRYAASAGVVTINFVDLVAPPKVSVHYSATQGLSRE